MKPLLIYSFIALFALLNLPVFAKDSQWQLYKRITDLTYQVKTSLGMESPKASYGTGFVVDGKKGLLITNYHVVSDVIQKKNNNYQNFVIINGQSFLAKILALDVLRDLALIKIDFPFSSEIRLRNTAIKEGEKLFSFGIPKDLKLSMVDGLYNGVIHVGPFSRILMSTPINSGMSGGPVTDSKGNLVGVNVSTLRGSDNISFSVPASYVDLLMKSVPNGEQKINEKNFDTNHQYVQNQILEGQQAISHDLKKNEVYESFDIWELPSFGNIMKCWMQKLNDQIKQQHEKVITNAKICEIPDSLFLSSDDRFQGTLYFSMNLFASTNMQLNEFQYSDYLNNLFNGAKMLRWENYVPDEEEPVSSAVECQESVVENAEKLKFQLIVCTSSYQKYPLIFETYFKFHVFDPKGKHSLMAFFTLDGFNKENAQSFIINFLKKVRLKKATAR